MGTGGIFIIAIIRTGSRGGFLGLIAVGLFMLFGFTQIPRRLRIGAVAAATAGLFLVAGPSYWESMATLLNPKADYNWSGESDTGRMEVWKRGIGYMNGRPIFGVGVNAFAVAEGTISPIADRQDIGIGVKWSAAHNSFVEIGAELGYPGLIAFILLFVAAFRSLRGKGDSRAPPGSERFQRAVFAQTLTASLVGYLVTGFFLSQAYAAFVFITLGMVVAMACLPPSASAQPPLQRGLRRRSAPGGPSAGALTGRAHPAHDLRASRG
jgi:O-antigen ligase